MDDFGADGELSREVREYHQFLADYMGKIGAFGAVHTKGVWIQYARRKGGRMPEPLNAKMVAATNPGVDPNLAEKAQTRCRLLERAGVFRRADYRISHPFGALPREKKVAHDRNAGS
jgi:hypothetical protein